MAPTQIVPKNSSRLDAHQAASRPRLAPKALSDGSSTCCSIDFLGFGRLDDKYSQEHSIDLEPGSTIKLIPKKLGLVLTIVGITRTDLTMHISYLQIERAFFLSNSPKHVLLILKYAARIVVDGERQSKINSDHGAIAQVLNRQLLVRCVNNTDRAKLEDDITQQIGMDKVVRDQIIITTHQNLYSSDNMDRVRALMSKVTSPVGFKIDDLLKDGSITPQQLVNLGPHIHQLESARGPKVAELVLIEFAHNLRRPKRLNPGRTQLRFRGHDMSMVDQLRFAASRVPDTVGGKLINNLCLTRFAIITATGVDLAGPLIEQSNSMIRLYGEHSDNFLRVSFRDENHQQYFASDDWSLEKFANWRFRHFLVGGLIVGGRKYDFFACSANGLKDQQAFFVSPFKMKNGRKVTAETMRDALGDLSSCERIAAKLLSRLGQTLSTTQFGARLGMHEVEWMNDVYSNNLGLNYCHTDGRGTISPELAREVNDKLDRQLSVAERALTVTSTCFQIRLGGCKGMLSIDPLLSGRKVRLRPSMQKFKGTSYTLDIAKRFNYPSRAFTNRPLIQILEALGVQKESFLNLQRQAIAKTCNAKTDCSSFVELLATFNLANGARLGPTIAWLVNLGQEEEEIMQNSFTKELVELATLHSLRELKFRGRIPVPHSYNLVGIADEDGYLEEGEVYICIHERGSVPVYLKGIVAVSRSPSSHPGDVQRARAVGPVDSRVAPRLAAQENCIVFSVKGKRPLPSMLSGGDLDGDFFLVLASGGLIPPRSVEAGEYIAAEPVQLREAANSFDLVNFFISHSTADCVGRIANLHLHYADLEREGVFAPVCQNLVAQYSQALDSSKTGREVNVHTLPKAPFMKPDFMQKEVEYATPKEGPSISTYKSQNANGHLFRAIGPKLLNPKLLRTFGSAPERVSYSFWAFDADLMSDRIGSELGATDALVAELGMLIRPFAHSLYTIAMSLSADLTEQEMLLGVMATTAPSSRTKRELDEQLGSRVKNAFDELRTRLKGRHKGNHSIIKRRAWAAIKAADRGQIFWGVRSFVWIALSELHDAVEAAKLAAN